MTEHLVGIVIVIFRCWSD